MTPNDTPQLYELEKVRFIIKDACAIDVAYAYEDLVFAEHGLFIIQFMDTAAKELVCWFNNETPETDMMNIVRSLSITANLNDSNITLKGRFEMAQKDDSEEIDLRFMPL